MKKFIAILLMVLSLLIITPTVYAQVDVTLGIVSAKCAQDGCILVWKATLLNESKVLVKGNVIVLLQDKDKNIIISLNAGLVSLEGSESKEVGGVILLERSERTKSIVYLTVLMENAEQYKPIPKIAI